MAHSGIITIKLGKNGLTQGMLELIEKTFKNHDLIKISVLKSCSRNKDEIKALSEKICSELEKSEKRKFTSHIIGFTLNIRKLKKIKPMKNKAQN